MKNLIIDCSCGMNIYVQDGDVVYSKIDNTQNKHTDNLLVVVDELLSESKLNIGQIDNICVCVGPGSFTGVRVAISIAKGLSVSSNKKVFVASNFDVMENNGDGFYILDGFSNFVYVRKIDGECIEDSCKTIEDFVLEINNGSIFVLTEKTQNLLSKFKINAKIIKNDIIKCFEKKILNNQTIELNQIEPIYLRASQAEIERNKKLNGTV